MKSRLLAKSRPEPNMPKGFDTSKDIAKFARHKTDVKRGMVREAKGAARAAQKLIEERAPEATGALKTSAYTTNREANGSITSTYEPSIVEAAGENMRIENRGQAQERIEPPSMGGPGDPRVWAAVGVPLDYADILRDGFHNVKLGVDVAPDPFFDSSVEDANAAYPGAAQRMLNEETRKLK